MVLTLRLISFHAVPAHLAKFDVVAQNMGLTRSGLLRTLMVKAVRDAAKQTLSHSSPALSSTKLTRRETRRK